MLGWLLGGVVGVGTAIFALLVGQSVALRLAVVHRFAPYDEGALGEEGFPQGEA